MELQDIRTLRVLEAMEGEKTPSQRELATTLNVSLGLVNSFLKRLARKGYFKITNLPANRISYILTPKGMAEKTRLTCEYIHYSFGYYREARARMKKIMAEIAVQGQRRLVFWGQGELTEIAYISLQEIAGLELVGLVDHEGGGRLFGRKILAPEGLREIAFDRLLVTAIAAIDEIRAELQDLPVPRQKILFIQ